MKIYLAWSGEKSGRLAGAFQKWLPRVIQNLQTFYSPDDIEKGARWPTVIASNLEKCNLGLLFVTPDNMSSTWIHFEAGALSKYVGVAKVCPILFGLESGQLSPPLSIFQNCKYEKSQIFKLLVTIHLFLSRRLKRLARWPSA